MAIIFFIKALFLNIIEYSLFTGDLQNITNIRAGKSQFQVPACFG